MSAEGASNSSVHRDTPVIFWRYVIPKQIRESRTTIVPQSELNALVGEIRMTRCS
jgi:hypothetical protein